MLFPRSRWRRSCSHWAGAFPLGRQAPRLTRWLSSRSTGTGTFIISTASEERTMVIADYAGTKWQFTTYERDAESGNDYPQAAHIATSQVLALWDNENSLQNTFPPAGPHGEIGPIQITPGAVSSLHSAGTLPANWNSNTVANLTAGGRYFASRIQRGVPLARAAAAYNARIRGSLA